MLTSKPCPKCHGIVVDDPLQDELFCIHCGWRPRAIPYDVQREVDAHLGQASIGRAQNHIPRGQPSPSWWERTHRRKERRSQTG